MTASHKSGAVSGIKILTTILAALVLGGSVNAQSSVGDLTFFPEDLRFIKRQIDFAERHRNGEELKDILPNLSVPWGLRTVDGGFNNLAPGKENFGRADEIFTRSVVPNRPAADDNTSYDSNTNVVDSSPRLISHLIVNQSAQNPAAAAAVVDEEGENIGPDIAGSDQFFIPNTAPDEGLSAPTNAYMTFFGQFFDHGLDLINKGGNGVVMNPIPADDPLFDANCDPTQGPCNVMMMTRATQGPVDANGNPTFINATTPHVDQQQTYASHGSSQILLRHYELRDGAPVNTGYLLDRGFMGGDDTAMADWNAMKRQALNVLGIELDDQDGANVPMIYSDLYGKFIPGDNGFPQLVVTDANGVVTAMLEGNLANPVNASLAARVNHSFFIDVAHSAAPNGTPDEDNVINARVDVLNAGTSNENVTRGVRASSATGTYDDELLGRHFMCGDGRCNENIALTTIHAIFHREHNRLADVAKRTILDSRDLAFVNEWLETPISQATLNSWSDLPFDSGDASLANQTATRNAVLAFSAVWNGEFIFQIARFATEMQYNRIVFDEFGPTISGLKDPFEDFHIDFDPSITAEFSQSVYRFGHSMLTETVPRLDSSFNVLDSPTCQGGTCTSNTEQLGLFEAFLNPLAWDNSDEDGVSTMSAEESIGAIVRGLTRETANEIDEFITGSMQNNLVGLPLDLGAINIMRSRDVGNPKLNAARKMFYKDTQAEKLKPYIHWADYLDNLRHELSGINFIAAYGTHASITGDYEARRAAACAIVSAMATAVNAENGAAYCENHGMGGATVPVDSMDFMYSRGAWGTPPGELITTGLDNVDFWNGGLAEERQPFGGYLGSTHNFVFENQIERLQSGDRFYYLKRTGTIPMLGSLESNTFTSLIMRNSDLGMDGHGSMALNAFGIANYIFEVDPSNGRQFNAGIGSADPNDAESTELIPFIIRDPDFATTSIEVSDPTRFLQITGGDHYTVGGTSGDDTIIGGIGDDSLWGRAGNDRIEGGDGADHIEGGPGDDIITDLGGPDVIEGGRGNDAIASGDEEDIIFGDEGNDWIVNASEFLEAFAGPGDDFIFDGIFLGHIRGGAGADWMENLGGGEDLFQGDGGAAPEAGEPAIKGHDIMVNHDGNNDGDMENGNDIYVDGPGIDRVEGQLGHDWVSFANDPLGAYIDLELTVFMRPVLPPSNATVSNRYDRTEGISGSPFNDVIKGTNETEASMGGNELAHTYLLDPSDDRYVDGFALIDGLGDFVPAEERRILPADPVTGAAQEGWTGGDIILGGAGSDIIHPLGGDDIVDGDFVLTVGISTPDPSLVAGNALASAQVAFRQAAVTRTQANLDAATAARIPVAAAQVTADAAVEAAQTTADNDAAAQTAAAAVVVDVGADSVTAADAAAAAADAQATANADAILAQAAMDAATAAATAAANAADAANSADMDAATALMDDAAAADAAAADADAAAAAAMDAMTAADAATAAATAAVQAAADALVAEEAAENAAILASDAMDAAAAAAMAAMTTDEEAMAAAMATAATANDAAAAAQAAANVAQAAADAADAEVATAQAAADAAQETLDAVIAAITANTDSSGSGNFDSQVAAALAASAANNAAMAAVNAANAAAAAAQVIADDAAAENVVAQAANDAAQAAAADAATALANSTTVSDDAVAAAAAADAAVIAATQAVAAALEAFNQASIDSVAAAAASDAADLANAAAQLAATRASNVAAVAAAAADLAMAALEAADSAAADAVAARDDAEAARDAANNAATAAADAAAASQQAADDAADLVTGALADLLAATATADASAAALGNAQAAAQVAAAAVTVANTAVQVAQSAANAANTALNAAVGNSMLEVPRIVVASMQDVSPAIFSGLIPLAQPDGSANVYISRSIAAAPESANDTDSVVYSGNFDDYTINLDRADDFIEVTDTRGLLVGGDGRDLVRNVERLVFADFTIVVGNNAGGNVLASGRPVITGDLEVGATVTADAGSIMDADGFDPTSIDFAWEVELEPGSGSFVTLLRLSAAGNDEEQRGSTLELTVAEAALNIRVVATFADNLGVFEILRSAPAAIANCEGCVIPEALLGLVPATFTGTAADIDADTVTFESLSRPGRARIDVTIPNVDLDLFANTGFGAPVTAGDEVAVDSFLLTFTDSNNGNVTGAFSAEIVAIQDPISLDVDQNSVNVLFSIRGADVAPLIVPTGSTATLTANGDLIATASFTGDSSANSAVNVEVDIVNGLPAPDPEVVGVPIAAFSGTDADIDADSVSFENASRPGLERFDVTVAGVDIDLFGGVDGLDAAFSAGETLGCGPLPQVCPGDEIAISGITLIFENSDGGAATFAAEIVAIEELDAAGLPSGVASQDAVNVLFSIRGADVAPLARGVTTATLVVGDDMVTSFTLFGDSSVNFAQDVTELVTADQIAAATILQNAQNAADAAMIAAAQALLDAANAAAPAAPEAGVPTAAFSGTIADLSGTTVVFENASRPGLARFDITVAGIDIDLFGGVDGLDPAFSAGEFGNCGPLPQVCPGDEIAITGFEAVFTNVTGEVAGTFAAEIVAIELLGLDGVTVLAADQNSVNVLFSIRAGSVAPLVAGATTLTVNVDGSPIAAVMLMGDSSVNDAQDVAVQVVPLLLGIGVVEGPIAANTDTVRIPAGSGRVDRRGRIRIDGVCDAGLSAEAAGLTCATDASGSFDCRGRNLAQGTVIDATCGAAAPGAIVGQELGAIGFADGRGRVRLSGSCDAGTASGVGLDCSTRRSGSFRCNGRNLAPNQEVTATCQ
jgi:hypothetical protein